MTRTRKSIIKAREPRTVHLNVRIRESDWAAIQDLANKLDLDISPIAWLMLVYTIEHIPDFLKWLKENLPKYVKYAPGVEHGSG